MNDVDKSGTYYADVIDQRRAEVRQSISDAAGMTPLYLIMNALTAAVASYGHLENSAAVVIGAMIIAMLLGPIFGLALALVGGNFRLLRLFAKSCARLQAALRRSLGRTDLDLQIRSILTRQCDANEFLSDDSSSDGEDPANNADVPGTVLTSGAHADPKLLPNPQVPESAIRLRIRASGPTGIEHSKPRLMVHGEMNKSALSLEHRPQVLQSAKYLVESRMRSQ